MKIIRIVIFISLLFPSDSSILKDIEDLSVYNFNKHKININSATVDQLSGLAISVEQAQSIHNFIIKRGSIGSSYELITLPNIRINDLERLKERVFIGIPNESSFAKNRKKSSYKIERWLSAEGNSEGLSELWLDTYYEPKDVNLMNYDDLMSLPNLSPVDAVAVLKQQTRGPISGSFQLKNSPGISYWGYKNLIDFVDFDSSSDSNEIHLRYSGLARTIPITTNPDDDGTISELYDTNNPEIFSKISVYNNKIKAGVVYHLSLIHI